MKPTVIETIQGWISAEHRKISMYNATISNNPNDPILIRSMADSILISRASVFAYELVLHEFQKY